MEKFSIQIKGRINKKKAFESYIDAMSEAKPNEEIVPVWEFFLWVRGKSGKDFSLFYSAEKNIEKAVWEAIEYGNKQESVVFAITNPTFGIVARYGSITEEFIQKSKSC